MRRLLLAHPVTQLLILALLLVQSPRQTIETLRGRNVLPATMLRLNVMVRPRLWIVRAMFVTSWRRSSDTTIAVLLLNLIIGVAARGSATEQFLRIASILCGGWGRCAIVKTEKRVVNVRFSYKQRVFVEHFIVLDLDDKFDVVMGMPWLARHDPVIDWKKRTLVRFGRDSGTESDGPVTAARAPAAGLHDEAPCDQAGLDIARPQTGSAGEGTHYRAAGLHEGACGQAGLDTARPRTGSAGEQLSTAGPGPEEHLCGAGLRATTRTLRKSRSGIETQQAQSVGQTEAVTPDVETLSVLTRTDTGFQYREMELASPPTRASELTTLPVMSWKCITRDLLDGRIEQVCVLSNSERTKSESEELGQLFMGSTTESEDTLSAKTGERFEEQGWDSLKSSPYYELLRAFKDVLPEDIPAELPQDKGVQHEIDLVPGTKYCVTR
ncbi:reverse transcriptase [Phytophthora cinnamomi]|uniref:reverse transcriptase n=1 Tax=Phytophthora cinnamomi TaxID=4785 RepID=UPI0035597332|nr:reverse transcriptase [Phytophthora cinnamomi]